MDESEARTLAAIAGITILESIALIMGVDGTFLLPSVAAIAGIAGYTIALKSCAEPAA